MMFYSKQPIALWFGIVFSANHAAKESIEDRVNKVEGNLQELSVKLDSLGSGLQSISRSVSKILEHLKLRPQTDRTKDGLSGGKDIKMSTVDVIPDTVLMNDTNLEEGGNNSGIPDGKRSRRY